MPLPFFFSSFDMPRSESVRDAFWQELKNQKSLADLTKALFGYKAECTLLK